MLILKRLYYTSLRGFDLLASLEIVTIYLHGVKIMKQLAFLIISSTPSLKNIAQISSHLY